MRIMMLGWELPPHNSGGLGVACYHMAKALAGSGAMIDFVLPYKADHPDTDFMTVHHTTTLEPLHRMGMGAYEDTAFKNDESGANFRAIREQYKTYVQRECQKNTPDVIHAHDWLTFEAGIAAKKVSNVPLIAHVHATEFDRAGNKTGNSLIHEIEYEGLMAADRILAVSNITKQIIIENYHIPANKIEVIHNSIDTEFLNCIEYSNTYVYASRMKEEGYTIVSTLGRLTVQKGLHHFLRAAAKATTVYDKLLFVIAGDGELRNELIQLSADLGIADRVLFTGFVRGEKWRDVYAISDVFVMSSVSEPFGLTALEAAANNTSLLISKQSGVCEVLNNILRFDYWDEHALADKLINVASSKALQKELSEGVVQEFAAFSWNDAAERCIRQYQYARVKA